MQGNKKYKEKNPENKIRIQENGPKSKLFLILYARTDADMRISLANYGSATEDSFMNQIKLDLKLF
jgi:hypothetical protein